MAVLLVCTISMGYTPTADAAMLTVVGGQLTGATGVDVGGTFFDVTFEDGTCVSVFSGCDALADFDFQTEVQAQTAASAILTQVLMNTMQGNFDDQPELTLGCTFTDACFSYIPFELAGGAVNVAFVQNSVNEFMDGFSSVSAGFADDFPNDNFARFTIVSAPVPAPASSLLLATGLLGLAGYRWQQRRREGTQVG